MASSVMERLREDTRELHARVERRVDLPRRCATLEGYTGLLVRMLGLYIPIESKLRLLDWSETGVNIAARHKSDMIRADLGALGACDDVPVYAAVPELRTLAAGFGCLYVIEGSTLGGQVILRHVRDALGLSPAHGASFFASYGPRLGAMWRAFGQAADAYCTTQPRVEEALDASVHTFEAFERWLDTKEGEAL